jgi:hypothetical protein
MGNQIVAGPPLPVSPFENESVNTGSQKSPSSARGPRAELWNPTTLTALAVLVLLWALKVYTTWGAWGNLTVDSGHEMYVPSVLAQGKQLYRDVWFMYGPAAPYFTSYLFRLFGVKLNVLYWAGCLSALGSAIFLFLIGIRVSSWIVGWTAGAVLLMESFQPSLFSFPLPYTSAAVYACLVGCAFLWLVVNASESLDWRWTFAAGTLAAGALLLKPEFGTACYATLGLMIVARSYLQRSWRLFARDSLALLPGIVVVVLVIRWMISIAGVDFITQENLVSWPTSYFMKTFGKLWLAQTGFTITASAFETAFFRTLPIAAVLLVAYCFLWWKRQDGIATVARGLAVFGLILFILKTNYFILPWRHAVAGPSFHDTLVRGIPFAAGVFAIWCVLAWKRTDRTAILIKVMLLLAVLLYAVRTGYFSSSVSYIIQPLLAAIFFPQDMVLYIALASAAAWLYWWWTRRKNESRSMAIALILTYSGLLAFRILMKMDSHGYPIFYNGTVVLSFLVLFCLFIPRSGRSRLFVTGAEIVICVACLTPVTLYALSAEAIAKEYVPLVTERGTVLTSKRLAQGYTAGIQFMKEKAALGQSVLSVPEDTSLFFLSGTDSPTRVFSFTPGVLAPGKMTDDMIREIDQKSVQYLIWSNRTFGEYGVPVFGKDFDREIGDYLKSHYHVVGPLIPTGEHYWDWSADIWERNEEALPK